MRNTIGGIFQNEKYDSVKLGYLVRFENRIKHMHSQAAKLLLSIF